MVDARMLRNVKCYVRVEVLTKMKIEESFDTPSVKCLLFWLLSDPLNGSSVP